MPQTVIKIIRKEYLIIFDGNTINIKYSLSVIMFNSAHDLQKNFSSYFQGVSIPVGEVQKDVC